MNGRRGAGPALRGVPAPLALALAVAVAGCGHLLGGGHPSGLADWDHRLRTLLQTGDHDRALELVSSDDADAGDELLRLQHEGLAAHYAGDWRRSSDAFERAFRMTEDRYTKSVSKAVLSMLASDRVLDYYPPPPERLLVHYYGALNYLRAGEPDEAAVEARRLGHLLGKGLEGDDFDTPRDAGAVLSRFAGAVFEAAGQDNDAAVAHRRALAFAGESEAADAALDLAAAPGPDTTVGSDATVGTGEVVVVVERGFVAHKVEEDVTLFLLADEVETLRTVGRRVSDDEEEVDLEEALEVAETVIGRELGAEPFPGASRGDGAEAGPGAGAEGPGRPEPRLVPPRPDPDGPPGPYAASGPGAGHRADARTSGGADDGPDPVLVRIAWPVYRETTPVRGTSRLVVGGDTTTAGLSGRVDVSGAVKAAYADRRPLDLAKTLVRAATKAALAEGVEAAVSEEDETLGEMAGWTTRIAGALLERADTRCWHLLPARLEMHRLRLPAGTHQIEALVPGRRGDDRRKEVAPVELEPGGVEVVAVRDWR